MFFLMFSLSCIKANSDTYFAVEDYSSHTKKNLYVCYCDIWGSPLKFILKLKRTILLYGLRAVKIFEMAIYQSKNMVGTSKGISNNYVFD